MSHTENRRRKNSDAWVLWTTGIFVVTAFFVFAIALQNPRTPEIAAKYENEIWSPNFEVVRIIDGDTMVIRGKDLVDLTVRLTHIDAPELSQPYGRDAKAALEEMIGDNQVHVAFQKKDKYGRYVADVSIPTGDLGRLM